MIVEGRTEQPSPKTYFTSLGMKQAALVCAELAREGFFSAFFEPWRGWVGGRLENLVLVPQILEGPFSAVLMPVFAIATLSNIAMLLHRPKCNICSSSYRFVIFGGCFGFCAKIARPLKIQISQILDSVFQKCHGILLEVREVTEISVLHFCRWNSISSQENLGYSGRNCKRTGWVGRRLKYDPLHFES